MNADTQMINETLERMLREQCSKALVDAAEQGQWPTELWSTLTAAGLPQAAAPERLGGSALPLAEALSLLKVAGRHALPLPLAETLLAGALLEHASQVPALPDGPVIPVHLDVDASGGVEEVVLDGRLDEVPWARHAAALLGVLEFEGAARLVWLDAAALRIEPGSNLAGEPRDTVYMDGLAVPTAALFDHPRIARIEDLQQLLALTRALLMAGAMQGLLDMAVGYALERKQFGRPIAAFQAVQQQLAVLAGDAAAALRAADAALEYLDGPGAALEMAVAKARVGEAAGRGTEIAHQVHGAMGFTYEHPLHQLSRRLWAWRDEYGAEYRWQQQIGQTVCAAGADALWATLTHT